MAVAPGRTLGAALEPAGADQPLNIGLHDELQHALCHGTEEVLIAGLRQQLGERQSVVGHRGSLGSGEVQ